MILGNRRVTGCQEERHFILECVTIIPHITGVAYTMEFPCVIELPTFSSQIRIGMRVHFLHRNNFPVLVGHSRLPTTRSKRNCRSVIYPAFVKQPVSSTYFEVFHQNLDSCLIQWMNTGKSREIKYQCFVLRRIGIMFGLDYRFRQLLAGFDSQFGRRQRFIENFLCIGDGYVDIHIIRHRNRNLCLNSELVTFVNLIVRIVFQRYHGIIVIRDNDRQRRISHFIPSYKSQYVYIHFFLGFKAAFYHRQFNLQFTYPLRKSNHRRKILEYSFRYIRFSIFSGQINIKIFIGYRLRIVRVVHFDGKN